MSLSTNSRVSASALGTMLTSTVTKIKNWATGLFATDSSVVHNTGEESIAGTKTFTSEIKSTASGANNAGLRCEYPSGETTHTLQVGLGGGNNGLKFDGSYAVKYNLSTGAVTFTGDLTGNANTASAAQSGSALETAINAKAADNSVVHLSGGDETIWGNKTFGNTTTLQATGNDASTLVVKKAGASSAMYLTYRANGEHGIYDSVANTDVITFTGFNTNIWNPRTYDSHISSFKASTDYGYANFQCDSTGHVRIKNKPNGESEYTLVNYNATNSRYEFKGTSDTAVYDTSGRNIANTYVDKDTEQTISGTKTFSSLDSTFAGTSRCAVADRNGNSIDATYATKEEVSTLGGWTGTYLANGANIDTLLNGSDKVNGGFYYLTSSYTFGGTFPDDSRDGFMKITRILNANDLWLEEWYPRAANSSAIHCWIRQKNTLYGGNLTGWKQLY